MTRENKVRVTLDIESGKPGDVGGFRTSLHREKAIEFGYRLMAAGSSAPTNADRIRAMDDEELAKFINDCEAAGYHDESITPTMNDGYHMDVLDWLRQPAEEVHDGQTI